MTNIALITLGLLFTLAPLTWFFARENRSLEEENSNAAERLKVLQQRLDEAKASLAGILEQSKFASLAGEHAPDGIVVQDMSGRILWSNPAFCKIHGRTADEVIGKHPMEFSRLAGSSPDHEGLSGAGYVQDDPRLQDFETVESQRADGQVFWNQTSVAFCTSHGNRDIVVQVSRDVTSQVENTLKLRATTDKLAYEASHDGLTGASNRSAFRDYFDEVVDDPEQAPVGVLHVDIDNFKNINDTHGHSVGDAVLVHITEVLKSCVRPADMVSRIGGDEFVVTCPNCPDLDLLQGIASDLLEKLAEPLKWGGSVIPCEASIGAAISGSEPTAEGLLAQADFALYEAKRGGRNQAGIYDHSMQDRHEKKKLRASELADALGTTALCCHFQPKMKLDTGEICGVEALVRWDHPTDGLIEPEEILPIAKELGLMAELDLFLMSEALLELKLLGQAGFENVGVAFNASPELLSHPDFMDRLIWETDSAGIERNQVTIEVLETVDFGDRSEDTSHAATIFRLNEAGYQIHLDDFGNGFAGLSHLSTLNVTGVKVDRSLVKGLASDVTSQKIVRKIIELSSDLSLTVVAEGVETSQTADALQEMGCDIIQGFWLAKPLQSKTLHSWLEVRRRQYRRSQA